MFSFTVKHIETSFLSLGCSICLHNLLLFGGIFGLGFVGLDGIALEVDVIQFTGARQIELTQLLVQFLDRADLRRGARDVNVALPRHDRRQKFNSEAGVLLHRVAKQRERGARPHRSCRHGGSIVGSRGR
jgi:hypothetical protein